MAKSDSLRDAAIAAASAEDWKRTIELLEQLHVPIEEDAELARAAGLAYAAVGRSPFDPPVLAKAVGCLSAAWDRGKRGPDIVWPLVYCQYDLGKQKEAAPVLAAYVEETDNPNQRVRAGAFLGMVKEVVGEYQAAVEAHQRSLRGLGEKADGSARLDSYLHPHIASAYGHAGRAREWMARAAEIWGEMPAAERTAARARCLLGGATMAADRKREGYEDAIAVGAPLLEEFGQVHDAPSLDELATAGRLQELLFWLYHEAGLADKASAMLASAKATIERLKIGRDKFRTRADAWQQTLFGLLHNLGCVCRYLGQKHEALGLLQDAVELVPHAGGPTFYALAALVLETGGDKKDSLAYLRRIEEDHRYAYGGLCTSVQKGFREDPAFEAVRDDPEFLAVVNSMRDS